MWLYRQYYINLNEEYIKINTKSSPSTDYVNIVSSPYRSTTSDKKLDSYLENSEYSISNDDVEMKLMVNNQR